MTMAKFRRCFDCDWHDVKIAVPDTAFCNQGVCKGADLLVVTAQHQRLHAIIVIEMYVHGRDAQIMVGMLRRRQAAGQVTFMVIENVTDIGYAITALGRFQPFFFDSPAEQVAKGLGPVDVATTLDQIVELLGQVVVNGNGNSSHGVRIEMGIGKAGANCTGPIRTDRV